MMNLFWASSVLAVGIRLEELEQTLESDMILSFGRGILLFWWLKMGECSWRVFPEGCDACEWTPVFHLTNTHKPHCRNNTRLLAKSPKQHLPSNMPSDDVPDSGYCWLRWRGLGTIPNVLIQCQIPYLGFDTASRTIFSFDTRCFKNQFEQHQQKYFVAITAKRKKVFKSGFSELTESVWLSLTQSIQFFRCRWGCTEHIQQGARMQQEPREAESSRAENSRPSSETVRKKYFFHQSSCFELHFNLKCVSSDSLKWLTQRVRT